MSPQYATSVHGTLSFARLKPGDLLPQSYYHKACSKQAHKRAWILVTSRAGFRIALQWATSRLRLFHNTLTGNMSLAASWTCEYPKQRPSFRNHGSKGYYIGYFVGPSSRRITSLPLSLQTDIGKSFLYTLGAKPGPVFFTYLDIIK